jgi:hyaluronoglucosaminidase
MRGLRRTIAACGLGALLVLAVASPAAGSPFEWRGIVEGAYGPTWTHEDRVRVLRWMPRHGFNAYVHAPKDDLWQRTNWRDPYPAAQQREFDREIALAGARGVEWIPNLSPALPLIPTPAVPSQPPSRDVCFSCPSDLEAVRQKLEPFVRAGSRTVMLSFDDVSKVMSNPQDLVAYGAGDEAFGRANGDFLSRLHDSYGGQVRVLTVGADYSGTQDTAYLRGLRATLRPEVEVMWTGPAVPSQEFAPADAQAYGSAIGRQPLVWENWTNNDTAGNATPHGAARIFLGPYRRRADVAGAVGGFFFNPMNEAGLNLLPLATAGDWLADPLGYRAGRSWRAALRDLAGPRRPRRQALRAWAEASWSNKLDEADAPTFARLSRGFIERYRAGAEWPRPQRRLLRELRLAMRPPARGFFSEQAGPWIEAARNAGAAGRLGARLLAAERPLLRVRRTAPGFSGTARPPEPARADGLRSRYRQAGLAWEAGTRFVYGWRGGVAFEVPPYAAPRNLMDEFMDAVEELDRSWIPRSGQASSEVTLTLDGQAVPLGPDGSFELPAPACEGTLVATDGAGGSTAVELGRCRRR